MSTAAKVALGAVSSLGVISISISAIATGGFRFEENINRSTKQDAPIGNALNKNSYTSDQFGRKYYKYFTSLNNNDGGDKRYEDKKTDISTTSGKFKEVNSGDSLKNKCEEAYKANETNDFVNSNNSKFNKEEVGKFCSKGGKKSKTVNEVNNETYTSSNLGDTKKTQVLSINSEDNQWIGDLKNKEFFNATHSSPGYFKKFFDDNKVEKTKNIKDACKVAYSKTTSTSGDDKLEEAEVLKGCGM